MSVSSLALPYPACKQTRAKCTDGTFSCEGVFTAHRDISTQTHAKLPYAYAAFLYRQEAGGKGNAGRSG